MELGSAWFGQRALQSCEYAGAAGFGGLLDCCASWLRCVAVAAAEDIVGVIAVDVDRRADAHHLVDAVGEVERELRHLGVGADAVAGLEDRGPAAGSPAA